MNTGCTIISGEYDFIEIDEDLEQKMWVKSPPAFNAEIAE